MTDGAQQQRGTILVVDDDPVLSHLLATVLTQAGFGVVRAEDGRRALQLMSEHRYAVVLLDDQLPGLAGIEVVEAVRSRPETSTVPMTLASSWAKQLPIVATFVERSTRRTASARIRSSRSDHAWT